MVFLKCVLAIAFLCSLVSSHHGVKENFVGGCKVLVFKAPKNWFDAYYICQAVNMDLINVESYEENLEVIDVAEKSGISSYWMGAHNYETGDYRWMPSGQPVIYQAWAKKQPDNLLGLQNCLARHAIFGRTGQTWDDLPCLTQLLPFICKAKPPLPNPFVNVPTPYHGNSQSQASAFDIRMGE